MPKHHCHALWCSVACPPGHLMCVRHWKAVPPALQAEVYRTFGLRARRVIDATWAPWWRASHRAIHAVALKERPDWAGAQAYLDKELAFADGLERAEAIADGAEVQRG
jgi:hypothetical protein